MDILPGVKVRCSAHLKVVPALSYQSAQANKVFKTSVLFLRRVGFFSFRLASFVFLAEAESSS